MADIEVEPVLRIVRSLESIKNNPKALTRVADTLDGVVKGIEIANKDNGNRNDSTKDN